MNMGGMVKYFLLLALIPALVHAQTLSVPAKSLPPIPSLQSTDQPIVERVGSQYNPGLATIAQIQAFILGPTSSWAGQTINVGFGGTGVQSITGPIKGNGNLPFSTAAATDISALWNGVCTTGTPLGWGGTCLTISGTGTLTSVQVTPPALFTASGCTITSAGNCVISWASGTGNQVVATPNGSSGAPTLRALVLGDIPALSFASCCTGTVPGANMAAVNLATSGNGGVTGIEPPANGGTGHANSVGITVNTNAAILNMPADGLVSPVELVPCAPADSSLSSVCPLTANATLTLTANGKWITVNCASACTITIPANVSVAYALGTCLTVFAQPGSAVVTLANGDTMTQMTTGNTGPRTITAPGTGVACKYGTTTWITSGPNET
jgi:hypothetical protein